MKTIDGKRLSQAIDAILAGLTENSVLTDSDGLLSGYAPEEIECAKMVLLCLGKLRLTEADKAARE